MRQDEIIIRDPFLLRADGRYYLYGTRSHTTWTYADGFDIYVSADLEKWEGPTEIFHAPEGFWATRKFWAPECVHRGGLYYLIATFGSDDRASGIQILRSNRPEGPFELMTEGPITPADWNCLDGTIYCDEDDTPWLVFSHSMPEEPKGAMCAMKLTREMMPAEEDIRILFYAGEAPWARPVPFAKAEFGVETGAYFSDGPYVFRDEDNTLSMLWSSWGDGGYTMGVSVSLSGSILGPWEHQEGTLAADGGHGMIYTSETGERFLVFHSPNESGREHPVFRKYDSPAT